jgi:hypothetical protein
MKKYIWGFMLIFIAMLCFVAVPKLSHTGSNAPEENILHVITADMKHEHTISWQSESVGEPGYLELRSDQTKGIIKIEAQAVELPFQTGRTNMLYTAHIKNLLPGTDYEYRLAVGPKQSSWKHFKTEPEAASFKALVFGDSQSASYRNWAQTAQNAWKNNQDAAFFINMGDLVDNGQDHSQWKAWTDGAAKLLASIPIAPVMGNHETYSLDWKMAKPDYYLALFSLPANGPEGFQGYAYSYDYGDVHFTVLNTQQYELNDWYPDLLEAQKTWLQKDLAQTRKKWKVILMHRGIWEFPFNGPLDHIGEIFVPVIDKYHVDVVFTAHVHSYARTKPLKNGSYDLNGTVYITTGHSDDRVWDKSPRKPMDEVFYNPLDTPLYLVLEASQDVLKVAGFKQNGELFDQTEITK